MSTVTAESVKRFFGNLPIKAKFDVEGTELVVKIGFVIASTQRLPKTRETVVNDLKAARQDILEQLQKALHELEQAIALDACD